MTTYRISNIYEDNIGDKEEMIEIIKEELSLSKIKPTQVLKIHKFTGDGFSENDQFNSATGKISVKDLLANKKIKWSDGTYYDKQY